MEEIRNLINQCMLRQGKKPIQSDDQTLRDLGFRSLDFSEIALRIEQKIGRELEFDAALLRNVRTVSDVLDFFAKASQASQASHK
jgi:acyl carrier protein